MISLKLISMIYSKTSLVHDIDAEDAKIVTMLQFAKHSREK